MELNPKTQQFIEKMGLMFERLGATRTAGRLLGILLMADKPMSLTELADLLQVSKASISTNARLIDQIGLAQRVSIPGDRRDYYEILPRSFERAAVYRMASIQSFVQLAKDGLDAIDEDNVSARTRLVEMRDLYQFMVTEMDAMMERWKERQSRDD